MTNLSRNEEEALDLFVHTPAESQSGFLRFAEETASMEGVKFGCVLDNHIIPLRPGRVMGLLARSVVTAKPPYGFCPAPARGEAHTRSWHE
jgi:hypothetical protein